MLILFFDTNAVIKYFCDEKGSDVIRWIVNKNINVSISISKRVQDEFPRVISKKVTHGALTPQRADKILARSKAYFRERFIVRDSRPARIPESIEAEEFIKKYGLQVGKNDWDANHIACVYNYLRFAGGVSSPRFVTSDNDFIRLVQQEGYTVLNPEKMTIEEVETRLTEIPSLSRS